MKGVRQCEQLVSDGEKLVRYSSLTLWSNAKHEYFQSLKEYCSFYNETKQFLSDHYNRNEMISERLEKLPEIPFDDYSGEKGARQFLTTILLYIFFPIAFLMLIKPTRYMNTTKDKVHQANRLLSSISFLIQASGEMN